MIRFQVLGQPVVCRSESTAGPVHRPWISDYRCEFAAGTVLPADVPPADLDRLLRAGKIRPVNR